MNMPRESLSPNKILLILLAFAVGAFCLFAALLVTLHTVEEGSELNQAFSIPQRWFERISRSDACAPDSAGPDCSLTRRETAPDGGAEAIRPR